MGSCHALYGLVLESDRALPGLEPVEGASGSTVRVSLAARPPWADAPVSHVLHASPSSSDEAPAVIVERLGDAGLRFRYGEGIRFHVSAALDQVWADWDPPLDDADAMTFLLGPILGYVLRAQGVLALHASAVVIDGRLAGFVGPAGAGKSTLAAGLAARGHAVLSDDVLALREVVGEWVAWPAHDQVRLWEESARALFGARHDLPALSAAWEKRALSLRARGLPFEEAPRRLGAIVLLDGDPIAADVATVNAAGGNEALLSLIGNTYVTYLLDGEARARELGALGRLAKSVAVGRLTRPVGGGDPAAVVAAVEAWVAGISK